MTVTNQETGTNINEVAEGICRINTPVDIAGGFSFNQYLVFLNSELDDKAVPRIDRCEDRVRPL